MSHEADDEKVEISLFCEIDDGFNFMSRLNMRVKFYPFFYCYRYCLIVDFAEKFIRLFAEFIDFPDRGRIMGNIFFDRDTVEFRLVSSRKVYRDLESIFCPV